MSFSEAAAGLCATCAHAREIVTAKGSTFLRCDLSFVDPRFARYPSLPVLSCAGYEPAPAPEEPQGRSKSG